MKIARGNHHTATLLPNGKVLAVGGSRAELYDPTSGLWSTTGAMNTPRTFHTTTLLANGTVLVAGGAGTSAELYNPATERWTTTGSPSSAYFAPTATLLLNGKVLVQGGSRVYSAELYDRDRGTWTATGSLTWDRLESTATLLRDGRLLVTGGYSNGSDIVVANAELYDPTAGTWTEIEMSQARWAHRATLLPNGNVLITGGADASLTANSSAEIYETHSGPAVPSISLLYHAAHIVSFYWSGPGALEQSDSLSAANWQPAPIQDNPQILSTTAPIKFYRIRAN
jgi:hypothetical protein